MSQLINPIDAAWLLMESADTPMHTGVMAIFKMPDNAADDYIANIVANLREQKKASAPWNLRLANPDFSVGITRMVEHRDFQLDNHFYHLALPAPGGERELGALVSMLHSNALDRHWPLWEFYLIEGLENRRFALYLKLHRVLLNDVNAVPLFLKGMAASARKRKFVPFWQQQYEGMAGPASFDGEALTAAVGSVRSAVSAMAKSLFWNRGGGGLLLPRGVPRSTLNRRINHQRRFATQHFEFDRVQALAQASDSSVNEILAYLCSSALRRFFKEYNVLPDRSLVGAVPVSLGGEEGKALAGIRLNLATHIGDRDARLAAIKQSFAAVQTDLATLPGDEATAYSIMRGVPIYMQQMAGIGRWVPPMFNLTISNTEGSEKPCYYYGAEMEALYPMNHLMQYSALSIDGLRYGNTFNVGFTGAKATLPHLQRIAVYAGLALQDLEEWFAGGDPS